MIGAYRVVVSNKYLKYEFNIKRNITVIKGNSATGKTTLIEMLREYNEEEDSGITVQCDKKCVVLYGKDWDKKLLEITDSIVFIDESGRFTKSTDFANAIQNTNNYYVIVSREKLSALPYSIQEIYGIRENGKYMGLKTQYTLNEFYNIYGHQPQRNFKPDLIITEDSNSGYDFYVAFYKKMECISANGKSNILSEIQKADYKMKRRLAIVDGAAFGSEMEMVMQYINNVDEMVELYAPKSFEYILLLSDIFKSKVLKDELEETYNYADSEKYFSWEQYYTALITQITQGTELQYSKSKLNSYYLSEKNLQKIADQLPYNIL